MIKAVIFDMGGVLVRTEDRAPREALAARLGMTSQDLERLVFNSESAILAELGRITDEEHWATLCRELRLSVDVCRDLQEQFWAGDRMDYALLDFLRRLRPTIKTGLLSNAWMGTREGVSRRFGGLEVFDVAVFSAEIGMRKPEEGAYRFILDRLGVHPAEAIFVDDSRENVEAAQALGMHAVRFLSPEQARQAVRRVLIQHHPGPLPDVVTLSVG